ncbi:MAG TPA: DUF3426 domain-containing protein [Lysobacter sp.]|nr:DUF3426 domain-containing protein [Lysobacter sp.]
MNEQAIRQTIVEAPAPAPARPHASHWRAWLALIALALVLALQLLLAQRHTLAADARWRPLLESVCGVLGCSLAPWREPDAFAMISRSVQPDPAAPGVLVAEARFRNDARWPQPWPTVWLELSSVEGPVAARAFRPDQYRPKTAPALIAPGQTVALKLRIVEPAPRIVAYMYDFR